MAEEVRFELTVELPLQRFIIVSNANTKILLLTDGE